MSLFLKKFETVNQYNAYTADTENFILPNVSLTVDNNAVHYNPSSPIPPTPSYESVDLGLPSGTLWARYNVGATSETEYGNYYQYGKGAAQYATTSGDSIYTGTEDPLALSADTVAQVWGGSWHLPTTTQCQELMDNTTYEWVTNFNDSGVNGGKFTAQNGNYLFFPANGYYFDGAGQTIGSTGYLWASTPVDGEAAMDYYFGDSYCSAMSYGHRSVGNAVRGVLDE